MSELGLGLTDSNIRPDAIINRINRVNQIYKIRLGNSNGRSLAASAKRSVVLILVLIFFAQLKIYTSYNIINYIHWKKRLPIILNNFLLNALYFFIKQIHKNFLSYFSTLFKILFQISITFDKQEQTTKSLILSGRLNNYCHQCI